MAELTNRERRQPALLDRLTDDDPAARQESRDRRVVSVQQMRRAVLRDMEWLLNTPSRFTPDLAAEFPLAAASVLNYGIPDLCGLTASSVDPRDVERMITSSIQLFEPRVMRGSVGVTATASSEAFGANAVSFEIRGEMWAQPLPEPLFVKTDVDLETGRCSLKEGVGGGNG